MLERRWILPTKVFGEQFCNSRSTAVCAGIDHCVYGNFCGATWTADDSFGLGITPSDIHGSSPDGRNRKKTWNANWICRIIWGVFQMIWKTPTSSPFFYITMNRYSQMQSNFSRTTLSKLGSNSDICKRRCTTWLSMGEMQYLPMDENISARGVEGVTMAPKVPHWLIGEPNCPMWPSDGLNISKPRMRQPNSNIEGFHWTIYQRQWKCNTWSGNDVAVQLPPKEICKARRVMILIS